MFLDTSALIEHFVGSKRGEKVADILRKEPCFISILSLAEIKVWCLRNRRDYDVFVEKANKIVSTVDVTKSICESGAEITHEVQKTSRSFGLMDGMILASARSIEQKLVTGDAHFRGVKGVEVV